MGQEGLTILLQKKKTTTTTTTKKQAKAKQKQKKQLHFHAIIICAVHEKSKKLFYDQIVNSY